MEGARMGSLDWIAGGMILAKGGGSGGLCVWRPLELGAKLALS